MNNTPRLPAGLLAFAERFALDGARWATRGFVELRMDTHPRARLKLVAGQGFLIDAPIARLPEDERICEALLDRVMLRLTAALPARVATPVIGEGGNHLMLEATGSGMDEAAVFATVGSFFDELDYWKRVARQDRP